MDRSAEHWRGWAWWVALLVATGCSRAGFEWVDEITPPGRLSLGDAHTCVIRGGTLYCWGRDYSGPITAFTGGLDASYTASPWEVTLIPSGIDSVGTGSYHTCATVNREAWCWGSAWTGQLGDGGTRQGLTQPLLTDVSQIEAGSHTTCAIAGGNGYCWGENRDGQVGDGTTDVKYAPVPVSALPGGAQQISVGDDHSCAIADGSLYCWGEGDLGALGHGTYDDVIIATPVTALVGEPSWVSAGRRVTCAIVEGAAYCWGDNTYGQLGDDTTLRRNEPVAVLGLDAGVTQVAAGADYACALANRRVYCWGRNQFGQLGDGTNLNRSRADLVSGIPAGMVALAAGRSHTCAMDANDAVFCWGLGGYGQLGDGGAYHAVTPAPTTLSGASVVQAARSSANAHGVCAVGGGIPMCWGDNTNGRLGDRSFPWHGAPADVTGLTGVGSVGLGVGHGCAVAGLNTLCWGDGADGRLGDGTSTDSVTPVQVVGLDSGALSLSVGERHACAVETSGELWCWGQNDRGQIGDGTNNDAGTPLRIFTTGGSRVACGVDHSCAVVGGQILCWGENDNGQLGDGTRVAKSTPQPVLGLPATGTVTDLEAYELHTCAIIDGAAHCWGSNWGGILGHDAASLMAEPVAGLVGTVTAIATGYRRTCAAAGGTVYCWGRGGYGGLGNGAAVDSATPVAVTLPETAIDLTAGDTHTCAATAGAVYCWGSNSIGQLGLGRAIGTLLPLPVVGW